jgi:hypothetical protein
VCACVCVCVCKLHRRLSGNEATWEALKDGAVYKVWVCVRVRVCVCVRACVRVYVCVHSNHACL